MFIIILVCCTLLTYKNRHSNLLVEKENGEADLQGARPHHVEKEAGILDFLRIHADQIDNFAG